MSFSFSTQLLALQTEVPTPGDLLEGAPLPGN